MFFSSACDPNQRAAPSDPPLATSEAALTQDEFCADGDPACTPSGAHAKHAAYACAVCHAVAGRLAFQRNGPAFGTGMSAPYFNATAKTCSNVGCHSVPAGTFSYYFPGDDGTPVLKTVSYGGGSGSGTPNWYSTGAACTACHGNPPSGPYGTYTWHSGYHGNQTPLGALNQCQLCHLDAYSTSGYGTAITAPSLHQNGAVNVYAVFKSSCTGCH